MLKKKIITVVCDFRKIFPTNVVIDKPPCFSRTVLVPPRAQSWWCCPAPGRVLLPCHLAGSDPLAWPSSRLPRCLTLACWTPWRHPETKMMTATPCTPRSARTEEARAGRRTTTTCASTAATGRSPVPCHPLAQKTQDRSTTLFADDVTSCAWTPARKSSSVPWSLNPYYKVHWLHHKGGVVQQELWVMVLMVSNSS